MDFLRFNHEIKPRNATIIDIEGMAKERIGPGNAEHYSRIRPTAPNGLDRKGFCGAIAVGGMSETWFSQLPGEAAGKHRFYPIFNNICELNAQGTVSVHRRAFAFQEGMQGHATMANGEPGDVTLPRLPDTDRGARAPIRRSRRRPGATDWRRRSALSDG